ncbi:MAG: transcription termination factor Rho [Planctomycetes bacterium]|jgi:transcription termination factor Rho|nr:transcription termination factor Rho [Planctomycetota bacterium]
MTATNGKTESKNKQSSQEVEPMQEGEGVLDVTEKGYGFLRKPDQNYRPTPGDVFVGKDFIRHRGLQTGLYIKGKVVPPHKKKGGPRLDILEEINGQPAEEYQDIVPFNDQVVVDPHPQLKLETPGGPIEMRVLDLICPIGKGQRGLLVAPPRSGKTILLQQIANAISTNNPECHLMILLVDERPEEVTDFRRKCEKAEVIASNNDQPVENHVRVTEFTLDRAKRMAESGCDVVILLDSLTRLGRAYNRNVEGSGRTMTGGVDIRALETPKRQFGAARKIENGGSLSILATALIETGSRMDDLIFEEFKGTGNMELQLDRKLAEKRIWPALDIPKSGTRKEELLVEPWQLPKMHALRRTLASMQIDEEVPSLLRAIEKHDSNEDFLRSLEAGNR